MTLSQILNQSKLTKIGTQPAIVMPLRIWRQLEERLEDLEMMQSPTFRKKIARARAEKNHLSSNHVKKLLHL